MCFGEAETDALTKCLRSAQGDPGILDVPGVTHAVPHVPPSGSWQLCRERDVLSRHVRGLAPQHDCIDDAADCRHGGPPELGNQGDHSQYDPEDQEETPESLRRVPVIIPHAALAYHVTPRSSWPRPVYGSRAYRWYEPMYEPGSAAAGSCSRLPVRGGRAASVRSRGPATRTRSPGTPRVRANQNVGIPTRKRRASPRSVEPNRLRAARLHHLTCPRDDMASVEWSRGASGRRRLGIAIARNAATCLPLGVQVSSAADKWWNGTFGI